MSADENQENKSAMWLWKNPPQRIYYDDEYMIGWVHEMLGGRYFSLKNYPRDIEHIAVVRRNTYPISGHKWDVFPGEIFPDGYLPDNTNRPVLMRGGILIRRNRNYGSFAERLMFRFLRMNKYTCLHRKDAERDGALLIAALEKRGFRNVHYHPPIGQMGVMGHRNWWLNGRRLNPWTDREELAAARRGLKDAARRSRIDTPHVDRKTKIELAKLRAKAVLERSAIPSSVVIRLNKRQRADAALEALRELGVNI